MTLGFASVCLRFDLWNFITHTYHGRYWTRDEKDNANAYYVHFEITEVETVVGEVSTFAPPAIVDLNGQKYEVRYTEKSATFTTKAILKKWIVYIESAYF